MMDLSLQIAELVLLAMVASSSILTARRVRRLERVEDAVRELAGAVRANTGRAAEAIEHAEAARAAAERAQASAEVAGAYLRGLQDAAKAVVAEGRKSRSSLSGVELGPPSGPGEAR